MVAGRARLDQELVARGLAPTRARAQALVRAGLVFVDGARVDATDAPVGPAAQLEVRGSPRFVSRGGEKLDPVLDLLGVNPSGRACLDAGASTGGFTDVLLQRGARLVYAVDVGYGQLDYRLRQDPRVVVMERTNARHLASLPGEAPDLVVGDMSFISLRQVVPALLQVSAPAVELVLLVKPQFEVGRGEVGSGGVVRDPAQRAAAVDGFVAWATGQGLTYLGRADAGVKGPRGNQETFVHLRREVLDG